MGRSVSEWRDKLFQTWNILFSDNVWRRDVLLQIIAYRDHVRALEIRAKGDNQVQDRRFFGPMGNVCSMQHQLRA